MIEEDQKIKVPPRLRAGPKIRPGFKLEEDDSGVSVHGVSPDTAIAKAESPPPSAPKAQKTPRQKQASTPPPPPEPNLSTEVPQIHAARESVAPETKELETLPIREAAAAMSEVIAHAALDSIFFSRQFFKKTFRQESPDFHRQIWSLLDDPQARYVNIQVQRDGAKTTLLRTYAAKRIAYGISRTILYVGASQPKAKQSVRWIKRQIEWNTDYAQTFGLRRGKTWSDEQLEILHGPEGHVVWVLALGITGSVRGVNLDDYRPDLIIIDDVMNEENSATPEQRLKITNLVLGALKESLSPATETPDAKMVLLNTPQDFEDLSVEALRDPQFRSSRFGCWTPETENLPVEYQESSWEARYPSPTLRAEKLSAIARNKYSIFAREKECLLITAETAAFRADWIKYFGEGEKEPDPSLHETWRIMVIDPVPPPSDIQIARGLQGKDFEAMSVVGRYNGKYYVLDTVYNRGHDPSWTISTFFNLCATWNPRKVIVESVAYQRVLAWLLREAMKKAGRYWMIEEFTDKRKKIDRIKQGLNGVLSNGELYVRKSQHTLISQIIHYPGKNPEGTHDDVIEAVAIGVQSLMKGFVGEVPDNTYALYEKDVPALEWQRGAP